jgi:N-acetylglutamate synthase
LRALSDIAVLEALAFDAWPAAEVVELEGWRLRATGGVTRRGNSVWTSAPLAFTSEHIARVEDFYVSRGLTPRFQVSELSPPGLDETLAARGYAVEAPTSIQVRELDRFEELSPRTDGMRVERRLFEEWFELSARRGRFAATEQTYRALLERIGEGAIFALAESDGAPAAVGLGVAAPPWVGIFSMLTLPAARRRGLGRAVIGALLATGFELGCRRAYLQVERDNLASLALYRQSGFRELYAYHYRSLFAPPR